MSATSSFAVFPDSSGSAAHRPGATRRGGADHTGQRGKCLCVFRGQSATPLLKALPLAYYLSEQKRRPR